MSNKPISKLRLWSSYSIQTLVCLFFFSGGIMNLISNPTAVEGAVEMGFSAQSVPKLGLILFVSTLLYALPKTQFLGALLLTAWLGGAVLIHVLHADPLLNKVLPVIFGILLWFSLILRNDHLKILFLLKI